MYKRRTKAEAQVWARDVQVIYDRRYAFLSFVFTVYYLQLCSYYIYDLFVNEIDRRATIELEK